jgi:hypothetical protein
VLKICVTSRGTLVGFSRRKPTGEEDALPGVSPEPRDEALRRAKMLVERIRGDFPEDLRLQSEESMRPERGSTHHGDDLPRPYWAFRWCRYDDSVRYRYSYIRVVVSVTHGVVEYEDQYLAGDTTHRVQITPQQAEGFARNYFREKILPSLNGQERSWRVLSEQNPVAHVWRVPGRSMDLLTYAVSCHVQVQVGSNPAYLSTAVLHVDAETGKIVDLGEPPNMYWAMHGKLDEER